MLSLVSESAEMQALKLIPTTTALGYPIAASNSLFNVGIEKPGVQDTAITQTILHSRPYTAAELADQPPVPLTVTDDETGDSVHTQWVFNPAYEPQIKRGDELLHYGMPVHFLLRSRRQYLTITPDKKFAAMVHTPLVDSDMDAWVLYPTKPIHVCLDRSALQCHFLQGAQVTNSLMRCHYTGDYLPTGEKRCDSEQTWSEVICFDDEAHPVFSSSEECRIKCQNPGYVCSGPPANRCTVDYTDRHIAASQNIHHHDSYDACMASCGSPSMKLLRPNPNIPTSSPDSQHSPSKVDWMQWAGLLCLLGLAVFAVYLSWRKLPTSKKVQR
jgi:hypothetical protein